jgi:Xaa-Pro aminopeptidase
MGIEHAERLAALRDQMAHAGITAYLVPRSDEFLGEYVPPHAERLAWLTGFSGSAGFALILADRAAVFSDGRYTLQLSQQVDRNLYQTGSMMGTGLIDWFADQQVAGLVIWFDPALHSVADIKRLESLLEPFAVTLRSIPGNLVDKIWRDQPDPPRTSVEPFLETFAGRSSAQKRQLIADQLSSDGYAAAVLADPADLAWLLNIRGRDVPHTPLALSAGVIYDDSSVDWIIDPIRVSDDILRSLGNAVRIVPPNMVPDMIMKMKAKVGREPVLMDDRKTSFQFAKLLEDRNVRLIFGKDPCIIPRACKTVAEQTAMRDAHRKDAVALIRFMMWFEENLPSGKLDELKIASKLEDFRARDPAFRGTSFDTIAGMGPNGAIIHYHANAATNRKIKPDSLLLLDSGAQYAGGTTDITRTFAVGTATEEMQAHYTAVLRAHIALASARFPHGTKGVQLDALPRAILWRDGLDYNHGTGHGVGCFLSVHEDAASISPRGQDVMLPGMIVSNEPGYYRAGDYGIRLENLVLCVASTNLPETFLEFETITLVPFDPQLARLSHMTSSERDWLAAYHTRIVDEIGPLLLPHERTWLEAVCGYFC